MTQIHTYKIKVKKLIKVEKERKNKQTNHILVSHFEELREEPENSSLHTRLNCFPAGGIGRAFNPHFFIKEK